jgi:hypothetical protein
VVLVQTPFDKQPESERAANSSKMMAMVLRKGFDPKKFWSARIKNSPGRVYPRNMIAGRR